MKPEDQAWVRLQEHGAAQLRPGFANRVLSAARAGVKSAPSLLGQFTLSAATAALCFLAVVLFHDQSIRNEESSNLADWQQIASATDEASLGQ
jgi:hypothetical protein